MINTIEKLNKYIKDHKLDTDNISDGFHSFGELYEFRKVYNAALFNEWSKLGLYDVHKSYKHHAGQECFNGDYFIVVAILPSGQISNHYEIKDWDLFNIPEVSKAKYPFDDHTGKDVINRIKSLYNTNNDFLSYIGKSNS